MKLRLCVVVALLSLTAYVHAASTVDRPVTQIQYFLNRHINEVKAGVRPAKTTAIAEIKAILKTADNYLDLEDAIEALKKFMEDKKVASNPGIVPILKLYIEKINFAETQGVKKFAALKNRLLKKAKVLAKQKPVKLDVNLKNYTPVVLSIQDNKKERRVDLFKNICKRHKANFFSSYTYKAKGQKLTSYNFIVEGNSKFVERVTSYYTGEIPKKALKVDIYIKTGNIFKKKESSITVSAEAALGVVGGYNYIVSKIINCGWKYIYENHLDVFKKHAKEKEVKGKKVLESGEGKIVYTVYYPGPRNIVLHEKEVEVHREYFDIQKGGDAE